MRLMILLTAFNLLAAGCQSVSVSRPDTNLCVVNVPALHEKCYNLKSDYDDNGQLQPGAKPVIKQYATPDEMLAALNKKIGTDPDGWAHLKAYIKELRDANAAKVSVDDAQILQGLDPEGQD